MAAKKTEIKNDNRVKITLPRAKGSEPKEVFVGINGVNYLVPKGKTSEVPECVAKEIRRSEAAAQLQDEEKERLLEASK